MCDATLPVFVLWFHTRVVSFCTLFFCEFHRIVLVVVLQQHRHNTLFIMEGFCGGSACDQNTIISSYFRENGYVVIPNLLSLDEVEALQEVGVHER